MRNCVYLFSLLLDGFVCSGAIPISAPNSPRNLSMVEITPAALLSIEGNRALQADDEVHDDNEERMVILKPAIEELGHVAEESTQMFTSVHTAVNNKPMPIKTEDTRAVEVVPTSYGKRSDLWSPKWTPTEKQMDQYKTLQLLLKETGPWGDGFDRIVALGYTPFSWMKMFNTRSFEDKAGLLINPQEELNHLKTFTNEYNFIIDSEKKNSLSLVWKFHESIMYTSLSQLREVVASLKRTVKIIDEGPDINRLLAMDVSPVIYATALTKDKVIEFRFAARFYFLEGRIKHRLTKRGLEPKMRVGKYVANEEQKKTFEDYCDAYMEKLAALSHQIKNLRRRNTLGMLLQGHH